MSNQSALGFLYGLQRHGIKLGLETIRALLASIGNPHHAFRAVHVAGTNGKGSTAAMVASMLQAAGQRVGLYTSPHLLNFTERIQCNGLPIPEDVVGALTDRIRSASPSSLAPTFFEFTTALAFQHFAEQRIDIAVVEVGMGGRFDATNVLHPFVTMITTVDRDHEEYLGGTVEAIAAEKCGIIKPGIPAVAGNLLPEAQAVVQRVCRERGAALLQYGRDVQVVEHANGRFDYRGLRMSYDNLRCALQGRHQITNAACALAAVECLLHHGITVPDDAVRAGLESVFWPGRLECVSAHPTILLDGAHNPAAAVVLAEYLAELKQAASRRLTLVVGMQRDKDAASFFRLLLPLLDHLVITRSTHPFSAPIEDLCAVLPEGSPPFLPRPTVEEAMSAALGTVSQGEQDDIVCVTGSIFVVGEAKALLQGTPVSPLRG